MAKRALLVGINTYPTAPLRGCVNDVTMVSEMLTKHFGFSPKEKRMLTDHSATTANILERLEWLVNGAKPGDILFFHYSGHGSQMINSKYDDDIEPDGLDEIICPVDLNWRDKVIKDDDLKRIFDRVPSGVHLTVVLDCCHSGSGMDQANQYQPFGVVQDAREFGPESPNRNRLLPMPADIANRGIGLDLHPRTRSIQSGGVDETGMLICGCQSSQTSADAWLRNMYCGAATHAFITTLARHNYDVDYKTVIDEMNQFMMSNRFSQRPELNGNVSHFGEKVLGGCKTNERSIDNPNKPDNMLEAVVEKPEAVAQQTTVPTEPTTPSTPSTPKVDKKKMMVIGATVVAVVVAITIFAL